jgi:hypothetical protein
VEIGGISSISSFWIKPAIVDRVSRAVVAVDGAVRSEGVTGGVSEEKTVLYGEFSQ